MKAFILRKPGDVENFTLAEVKIPNIQSNEILIKVKAIGINPVDAFVRQNGQALLNILQLLTEQDSYILGWDVAGSVVKTGKDATGLDGKDVFGMINFPGQGKAYAEYVAAPAGHVAVKPENISYEEAAAACLAALTAWQALVTHAKVQKGEKILIHAAAGGVGHYAVQIAKHLGAYAIGTASYSNKDFVLNLGANEFIDYTKEKFEDKVKDVDVVLDSIGGDNLSRSIQTMKKGGRIISIKGYFDGEFLSQAKDKEIFTYRMGVKSDGEDMEHLAALLEKGSIKSYISKAYHFEDLPQAHQQIETGKTRGKIVVSL